MDAFDRLLAWFRRHARSLPWREEPRDPYRVLVSELMLQQTQVDRVVVRFGEFLARFPDLGSLAAADEAEVVAAWSGLGYYRRARSLHRAARAAVAAGGLPRDPAALEDLPGIGPYTAAAVASLAFGLPAAVLDGNVLRVASRVLALDADPRGAAGRRAILAWVEEGMAGRPPGAVNEALMELGAVVCRPRDPACGVCPLTGDCAARSQGRPLAFPRPRRTRAPEDCRWVAACAVDPEGRWLLRRVDEGPILRGLWLPPFADLATDEAAEPAARRLLPLEDLPDGTPMQPVRHSITHRRIEVHPVCFSVPERPPHAPEWRWAEPSSPGLPTSSLLAKLVRQANSYLSPSDGEKY